MGFLDQLWGIWEVYQLSKNVLNIDSTVLLFRRLRGSTVCVVFIPYWYDRCSNNITVSYRTVLEIQHTSKNS